MLDDDNSDPGRKRKRSRTYHVYDAKVRAKIANLAEEMSVTYKSSATCHEGAWSLCEKIYRAVYSQPLPQAFSARMDPQSVAQLQKEKRGRPLYHGKDSDSKVIDYPHAIRESGCVLN